VGPRVRVDKEGRVTENAHAFVQYAQKGLVRPTVAGQFEVQEEIGIRDLIGARALWNKHMPQYAELTR
jgi:hypothetical protein